MVSAARTSRTVASVLALFGVILALPSLAADYAIVANQTIYRGTTISAADLKAVKLIRQPQPGMQFISSIDEIEGRVATRTILPGRFIAPASVRPAFAVRNGDVVRVTYAVNGLSISVNAVVLADATAGSVASFRNPRSGRTFMALVREDGTAEVIR